MNTFNWRHLIAKDMLGLFWTVDSGRPCCIHYGDPMFIRPKRWLWYFNKNQIVLDLLSFLICDWYLEGPGNNNWCGHLLRCFYGHWQGAGFVIMQHERSKMWCRAVRQRCSLTLGGKLRAVQAQVKCKRVQVEVQVTSHDDVVDTHA